MSAFRSELNNAIPSRLADAEMMSGLADSELTSDLADTGMTSELAGFEIRSHLADAGMVPEVTDSGVTSDLADVGVTSESRVNGVCRRRMLMLLHSLKSQLITLKRCSRSQPEKKKIPS